MFTTISLAMRIKINNRPPYSKIYGNNHFIMKEIQKNSCSNGSYLVVFFFLEELSL